MNVSAFALAFGLLVASVHAQSATNTSPAVAPQKGQPPVKGGQKKVLPYVKGSGPTAPITSTPQSGTQLLLAGGSDDCSTPEIIAGTGNFFVDNVTATTGAQGQNTAICFFIGTTAVRRDVWFQWTAPASGITYVDMCAFTTADAKLAVYAATGCPTPGSAVACNDDACGPTGFTPSLTFNAVAGTTYMLQFGNWSNASGSVIAAPYSTFFSIEQPVTGPEDNCATPTVLAGPGPFAVDTRASSTGAQGQTESACVFFVGDSPAIELDNWYRWTSVTGGVATVSTCGSAAGADTRIAIYAGIGCPAPGSAIACDDDTCATSLESSVKFLTTAGQTYTIQVGSFPGATLGFLGSLSIVEQPPATNDNCNTPTVLAGPGPYAFDNTLATTGVQGQAEAQCLFFNSSVVQKDVWFQWTAPFTGQTKLSFCGLTGADTRAIVYPAGGCPALNTSIACNDDSCGFQSEVLWSAVNGASYLIQIGNFPNTVAAGGAFSITQFTPPAGDDCATPVMVAGPGPHPFRNSFATTGVQGQNEGECDYYQSTNISRDLWYCWTAPSSGKFDVSTVGLTTVDTKLAVYAGCGCPSGAAISCADDACGSGVLQSATSFVAVAGQSYTIQIGSFPGIGATYGPGTFVVQPNSTPDSGCRYDDGASNGAVRSGEPVTGWLQRFGEIGVDTPVPSVQVVWGGQPLAGVPNGAPAQVLVFEDPNDDGDPSDAVLLDQIPVMTANANTDTYNVIPLPVPRMITGYFFLGAAIQHSTTGVFPAPIDDECVIDAPDRAWVLGDVSGTLNFANLAANTTFVPLRRRYESIGAVFMIRTQCAAGLPFCASDGSLTDHTTACPCGNTGATGNGCANSFNAAGGHLAASGLQAFDSPSTPGQIVLTTSGIPTTSFGLYMQHSAPADMVFHDGVICAGGTLVRLRGRSAVGGVSQFPDNNFANDSTLTLHSRGGVTVGSGTTRYYATWYRSAASTFCPPATANVTNGYTIVW